MTNECRMTPEQWAALLDVIDTAGDDWAVEARAKARRLLVAEPEQATIMACEPGNVTQDERNEMLDWLLGLSTRTGSWAKYAAIALHELDCTTEQAPADAVLTFGQLDDLGWFELTGEGWDDDRIRLLAEDQMVYDPRGIKRNVGPMQIVRRLPDPEWSL